MKLLGNNPVEQSFNSKRRILRSKDWKDDKKQEMPVYTGTLKGAEKW